MADAVYAIEDFPDDDLLWRIEWIGGVGYNTSVPSDPQIEICLAQLPAGETNPLAHFPGNDGVQTDVVVWRESLHGIWRIFHLLERGKKRCPTFIPGRFLA